MCLEPAVRDALLIVSGSDGPGISKRGITLSTSGAQWPAMSGDPAERVVFWGAAFIASGITASLLFLPMLIAVVLAEAFAVRLLLINVFGAVALALLAYQGAGFGRNGEESIDRAPPLVSREFEIAAAAGATFGLIYWLIAGRKAGRWRERV